MDIDIVNLINNNKNKNFLDLDLPFKFNLVKEDIKYISYQDGNHQYAIVKTLLENNKISLNFGMAGSGLNKLANNIKGVDLFSEIVRIIRQEVCRSLVERMKSLFKTEDYIFIPDIIYLYLK